MKMKQNNEKMANNDIDDSLPRLLRPVKSRLKSNRSDGTNLIKYSKGSSSSKRILSVIDLNSTQPIAGKWIFKIEANKTKENRVSTRCKQQPKRLQSTKKNVDTGSSSSNSGENQKTQSTLKQKSLQQYFAKKPVEPAATTSIKESQMPSLLADPGSLNNKQFFDAHVNGQILQAYVDLSSECVTLRRREAIDILKLEIEKMTTNRNLHGYGNSCVIPIGVCNVKMKIDMIEADRVQVYIVADNEQSVPMIVGQSFTDRPNVTVVQKNGKLRLFDSSILDIEKLPQLLSLSSLLNQLQPNVRWSSSLKIQDREVVQPERTFKYSDMTVRFAAPNQLQPKPNVSDLAFGKYFTDHMLKIYYHEALGGWQIPEITPLENLVLHPAAKVLHYAIELFEGMKAYRGIDGKIRVFRPEMNMERMNASAVRSGLPTFNGNELIKCINRLISIDQEWVPHSEASSLYIRPTLIGIDPTLGVAASDSALLYVILSPAGSYFAKTNSNRGVSLLADPRYTRAWPGGCGDRKMGSNYAPTLHVQKEAAERGFQQVLWLFGEDHQVTEVGTMNIFMFCINDDGEKELITPPLNGLILPGITRNSILTIAKEWNQFKVTERVITMPEVVRLLSENRMLELFGAGTAAIVSPISHIRYIDQDLYLPTLDQPEPIHRVFSKHLTDIQYGYVEHPWAFSIE